MEYRREERWSRREKNGVGERRDGVGQGTEE